MDDDIQDPGDRKRDRLKARARRAYDRVPLSVRTGDLPKRAGSAVVMLAVAGLALWAGGLIWRLFILAIAVLCFAEFTRLVWRATARKAWRAAAVGFAVIYVAIPAIILITRRDWLYDLTDIELADLSPLAGMISILAITGLVICTDTGAYFAGRSIGGPRIAPRISPSKTWAGLFGGMTLAALWAAWIWSVAEDLAPWESAATAGGVAVMGLYGAALAVLAQCGDFFESWLKRKAAVKDSSNLIPGHGGVLDRFDGLIPVAIASMAVPFPFGSGPL